MLVKILAVSSVVLVCNGLPLHYSNKEHPNRNHAVSSQSFYRKDVPFAYEFKAIHPFAISNKSPKEIRDTELSYSGPVAYSRGNPHQNRQQKPKNAQYLIPEQSHFQQNSEKYPVQSLQYAPVHSAKTHAPHETSHFKYVMDNEPDRLSPYKPSYIKHDPSSTAEDSPLFDPVHTPAAHHLHLNTYQMDPVKPEKSHNLPAKGMWQPQQMFQMHPISTNTKQQMIHPVQGPVNKAESIVPPENFRQFSDQFPLPQYVRQYHHPVENPKMHQHAPTNVENHPNYMETPKVALQYPAQTRAIFRTNLLQHEAHPSDNVKISYLYPITVHKAHS